VQAPPLRPTAFSAGARRIHPAATLLVSFSLILAAHSLVGTSALARVVRPTPVARLDAPITPLGAGRPATSLGSAPVAGAVTGRVPRLRPPVAGPLVRGFEAPAGPFGPGHRGVDFAAGPGTPVRSPAGGRVTFAGPVAGTTWVTVEATPGVLASVGPLRTTSLSVGAKVAMGGNVGPLVNGHRATDPTTGAATTAVHLSLRVDGVYVDPLPWLAGLGAPRLVPLPEPGGPH
jgi:murein DD-endopeptidase MepM/ murein hydrolase activator NlpD